MTLLILLSSKKTKHSIQFGSHVTINLCDLLLLPDEVICNNDRLDSMCNAMGAAGLSNMFFEEGQWTIFAPSDHAFSVAPDEFLDVLQHDDVDLLANYLLYHTSDIGAFRQNDLPCVAGQNLIRMANGMSSRTLCDGRPSVPMYQTGAGNNDENLPKFVEFDLEACTGVVHIIDEVMMYKDV